MSKYHSQYQNIMIHHLTYLKHKYNVSVTDLGQQNQNRIKWDAINRLTPRKFVLH